MIRQLITNPKNSIWLVILIQVILIFWVFQPFFLNGENIIFCPFHDGLKNYFTYYTYLFQDSTIDIDSYNWMNYPYGEYIFYTDQTPSLVVPLKWITENIFDLKPYAFRIFNWFCISGILLSSIFSWLILKKITKYYWIWSIFAITLPWISSQVFRLGQGHFNLSFSWTYLLIFYLLIQFYQNRHQWKKVFLYSFFIFIATYIIAFIHLYYLPMLCLMIGMFGIVIGIWERKNIKKAIGLFSCSLLTSLISLLSVWLTVRLNDDFYPLRKKVETAYNWGEWSLKPDALWTSYDFSTFPSILSSMEINTEGEMYLGAFAVYGFLILLSWLLVKTIKNWRSFRPTFKTYFSGEKGAITLLLLFSGLMCLNVAIGEYVKVFNNNLSTDNPLHPFKYARLLVGEVTQFRVLARFGWVCFWAFNFVLIFLFDSIFEKYKNRWIRGVIILLMLTSILDMVDNQKRVMMAKSINPLFNQNIVEPIDNLIEGIEIDNYQAILPLPFYAIGSEVDSLMIMTDDAWRTETFIFALSTNLPLMASNLSRSAVVQHEAQLSIFTEKGANDYLLNQLNEQPILVFKSKNEDYWNYKLENERGNIFIQYGKEVPEQYQMKLIKSTENYELYEWNPSE